MLVAIALLLTAAVALYNRPKLLVAPHLRELQAPSREQRARRRVSLSLATAEAILSVLAAGVIGARRGQSR